MTGTVKRGLWLGLAGIAIVVAAIEGSAWIAAHPQDVPWTKLDLDQPIGRFTGPKLAALGDDPRRCRALAARQSIPRPADRPPVSPALP